MCECTGCHWCTRFHVTMRTKPIAGKQCYEQTTAAPRRQCPHLTHEKNVCHWCLEYAIKKAQEAQKNECNVMAWAASKPGPSAVDFAGASQHLPTASVWATTTTSAWATARVEEPKIKENVLTKEDGLRMTKCLQDMNENIKNVENNLQQWQEKETETATNVKEIRCMLACLTKRFETLESELKSVLPSAPPGLPSPPGFPSASDGG